MKNFNKTCQVDSQWNFNFDFFHWNIWNVKERIRNLPGAAGNTEVNDTEIPEKITKS